MSRVLPRSNSEHVANAPPIFIVALFSRPATRVHAPSRNIHIIFRSGAPILLFYPAPSIVSYRPKLDFDTPMLFFHNTSSPASAKVDAAPTRRRSTTISMMEEEFGMRDLPRTTRFGRKSQYPIVLRLPVSFSICLQAYRPGSGSSIQSARGLPLKLQSHVETHPF